MVPFPDQLESDKEGDTAQEELSERDGEKSRSGDTDTAPTGAQELQKSTDDVTKPEAAALPSQLELNSRVIDRLSLSPLSLKRVRRRREVREEKEETVFVETSTRMRQIELALEMWAYDLTTHLWSQLPLTGSKTQMQPSNATPPPLPAPR